MTNKPAQVTEAHRKLWIILYNLAYEDAFNGIDSDAKATQLIADNEAMALQSATTRADCLQKEVDRWTKWNMEQPWLAEIRGYSQQVASLTVERDQLRAEVDRLRADDHTETERAEFYWKARTERAEAELAKERARLDFMNTRGFEHRHHETGDWLGRERRNTSEQLS